MKMTDIFKKIERKNWNFEQGFGTKEAKKQSGIKVCYKNDEELKNWVIFWKNVKKKLKFWAGVWGERSEETIWNQSSLGHDV
jgi:hypothetical protein